MALRPMQEGDAMSDVIRTSNPSSVWVVFSNATGSPYAGLTPSPRAVEYRLAPETCELQADPQDKEQIHHLERRIRELTEQLNCLKLDRHSLKAAAETIMQQPDAWLVLEEDGYRYLSGGEGQARERMSRHGGVLYPLYRGSQKASECLHFWLVKGPPRNPPDEQPCANGCGLLWKDRPAVNGGEGT